MHLTDVMGDQALEFLEARGLSRPFCLSISSRPRTSRTKGELRPRGFVYAPRFKEFYRDSEVSPARPRARATSTPCHPSSDFRRPQALADGDVNAEIISSREGLLSPDHGIDEGWHGVEVARARGLRQGTSLSR